MKRYRGKDGSKCLWYEPAEVEGIMQSELEKANLLPKLEAPVVDIETFIEGHLRAKLDQHAPLHPTLLGSTEFRAGAPPLVQINRDLTNSALDDDGCPEFLLGRWRATLAHEASHVVLHRCLFQLDPGQRSLFDSLEEPSQKPVERKQQCLKRDVAFGAKGNDWREVQANMGMAALLMPKPLFLEAFHKEMDQAGCSQLLLKRHSSEARSLAAKLAAIFQVSRQAASIRFETLSLLSDQAHSGLI